MTEDPMTPAQQKCDDEVGHDWEHFAYEPDTNAGGYLRCRLCDYHESDEGHGEGDFDDNYC